MRPEIAVRAFKTERWTLKKKKRSTKLEVASRDIAKNY